MATYETYKTLTEFRIIIAAPGHEADCMAIQVDIEENKLFVNSMHIPEALYLFPDLDKNDSKIDLSFPISKKFKVANAQVKFDNGYIVIRIPVVEDRIVAIDIK